jgi:hypothetical protein
MSLEEFRSVNVGDEVVTKFDGIGIVEKRFPKCVQILAWVNLTMADSKHCSFYDISELKCKYVPENKDN